MFYRNGKQYLNYCKIFKGLFLSAIKSNSSFIQEFKLYHHNRFLPIEENGSLFSKRAFKIVKRNFRVTTVRFV